MLIRTFVLKIINNETKYLTHHEIIDCTAHELVSVIAQMCKEIKMWIHSTLQRLNFSLTYSFKFTYIDLMYVDIWTLKKDILLKKTIISLSYLRSRDALRKLQMQLKNCWVNFISGWYLLRIMVFLVRRRAAETLNKSKKISRKKKLKNEKKEKWRMQRKSSNNNKYLCFYLSYKKSYFARKHSLKKVVYTKKLLYLRWNKHHLKLMIYITSSVSFWYTPCYKNILNYDSDNKCQKGTTIYKKRFFLIVEQMLRGLT